MWTTGDFMGDGDMRNAILIVDDDDLNREILKHMFEHEYKIITAEDGKEAINLLGQHMREVAVILLDLIMPVLNGYQVLKVLSSKKILDKIPVILITSQNDEQTEFVCYSLGASAVISKPFVAQTVRQRVNNLVELYRNADDLEGIVREQQKALTEQRRRIETFSDNLIDVISNIVEFRNLESGQHVKRVKGLTRIMADRCMELYPEKGLTGDKIDMIVRASALHDIGKISISDNILLKPGKLTDDERKIMMSHTTRGCDILKLTDIVQDDEQYKYSYDIVRHHHERYDGKGYPDGLKGDEIPLSAQLVSVADVYDALVSERVYKKAFDKDKAFEMIMNGECGVFSDEMFNCFVHARDEIEVFTDNNK